MHPAHSVVCPVLVGRDEPLGAAHDLLARARRAEGSTLIVSGEAGVGKSRLLRAAMDRAREEGFVVLEGACFDTDRALPYALLLDLVRTLAASGSAALAAHCFESAAGELVATFPELRAIFPDAEVPEALEPEQQRGRLVRAVVRAIQLLTRTQPVLLIVEDVHWSDEASLDLVLHLARGTARHALIVAASYRTDEVDARLARVLAELDRSRLAVELPLARLAEAEVASMLGAIFGAAGAPGVEFARALHGLTEGNPFFVEEVLKALATTGDLTRTAAGRWRVGPLERVRVPRTAVEAVRRRLTGLGAEARELASLAAVAGRRFDFALLQALTGHDDRALLAHIKELLGAQLVVEDSPDRFAFRHALTREAIYAELLARERVALHRDVAAAIERLHADALDAHVEALAYHAFEGGAWARAIELGTRAAEHALALHAPSEALSQLARAFAAAERAGTPPDAALRTTRGRARETLGDFHGAHEDFAEALALARAAGRREDEWRALHALGMLWAARDYARAGEHRRDALSVAREIGDDTLIARSLNRVGNWHINLEQAAPALRYHEEALALFDRAGDRRGVMETIDLLAMTYFMAGRMRDSTASYERAVTLCAETGERRVLSNALALLPLCAASNKASCTAFGPSALADEVVLGDRPIRLAREIGWRAGEAFNLYVLADALAWRGAYDRAIPMAREALAIAEELDHLQWQCGSLRALGVALLDLLAPEEAEACLARAEAIAVRLRSPTWRRWAGAPLAIARARLGDIDGARALLDAAAEPAVMGREALAPGDDAAPTLGERMIAYARVETALAAGEPERALAIVDARLAEEYREADARGEPASAPPPRLSLARGEALAALGRLDEAELALGAACAEAAAHGGRAVLWRAHAALGRLYRAMRRRTESKREMDEARRIVDALIALVPEDALRERFAREAATLVPATRAPTPRQAAKAEFEGLTRRERDVATLVAHGKANRAIARALGIGERTVEGYVAAALAKLDFESRAQLAAWAVSRGLAAQATTRPAR